MKLTLKHPAAIRGLPVFVSAEGLVLQPDLAIRKLRREQFKMTFAEFGRLLGASFRTVNGWEQGRPISQKFVWRIYMELTGSNDTIRKPKASP